MQVPVKDSVCVCTREENVSLATKTVTSAGCFLEQVSCSIALLTCLKEWCFALRSEEVVQSAL